MTKLTIIIPCHHSFTPWTSHSIMRDMKKINLTGQKFDRLVVLGDPQSVFSGGKKRLFWKCKCDCGNVTLVTADNLRSGITRSCGCFYLETRKTAGLKHGMRYWPEYKVWLSMKQRCLNPKQKAFGNYGARGIDVCERWKKSFSDFIKDIGRRPSKLFTLERKNNDLGYSPQNVVWATRRQQARNQRSNIRISFRGKTMIAKDWAQELGLEYGTIIARRKKTDNPEQLLRPCVH